MILCPDFIVAARSFGQLGRLHHSINSDKVFGTHNNRRFTRLTNGFSKKVENHAHSVALFAIYYNFVRIQKTLRTTPAVAAKATERLWEIGEAWEPAQVRRSIWEEGHGMV